MSLQGIQVPFQSIDRASQSLFFGASIYVQSIESWTVCMESGAIPLNDRENLDVHAVFSPPYTGMRRLRQYSLILGISLPRHVLPVTSSLDWSTQWPFATWACTLIASLNVRKCFQQVNDLIRFRQDRGVLSNTWSNLHRGSLNRPLWLDRNRLEIVEDCIRNAPTLPFGQAIRKRRHG